MRYIAKHYVRHEGVTHVPGEHFDAMFSKADEKRLLELEAIAPAFEEASDAYADRDETETEFDADDNEEADINEIDVMEGIGSAAPVIAPVKPARRKRT